MGWNWSVIALEFRARRVLVGARRPRGMLAPEHVARYSSGQVWPSRVLAVGYKGILKKNKKRCHFAPQNIALPLSGSQFVAVHDEFTGVSTARRR
jgi:hypothetical protein